jgi:hypothetical protein
VLSEKISKDPRRRLRGKSERDADFAKRFAGISKNPACFSKISCFDSLFLIISPP